MRKVKLFDNRGVILNNVIYNRYPGGKKKALIMSYDDGQIYDRRLVEIFNRYGIKGTFHINSGILDRERFISRNEVKTLFTGHEVSVHTVTHPILSAIPKEAVVREILEDKRVLEELVGYPVRGMSYPYGRYNRDLVELLPALGMEYSRTVSSSGGFSIGKHFLEWQPTCHHREDLLLKTREFLDWDRDMEVNLMYVWGHSFEFDRNDNWHIIEDFCALIGGREDIWYATNIEIVDYMNALKLLKFSVKQDLVFNPTASELWITVNGRTVSVKPGKTVQL